MQDSNIFHRLSDQSTQQHMTIVRVALGLLRQIEEPIEGEALTKYS